jgi:hypothetical protein
MEYIPLRQNPVGIQFPEFTSAYFFISNYVHTFGVYAWCILTLRCLEQPSSRLRQYYWVTPLLPPRGRGTGPRGWHNRQTNRQTVFKQIIIRWEKVCNMLLYCTSLLPVSTLVQLHLTGWPAATRLKGMISFAKILIWRWASLFDM